MSSMSCWKAGCAIRSGGTGSATRRSTGCPRWETFRIAILCPPLSHFAALPLPSATLSSAVRNCRLISLALAQAGGLFSLKRQHPVTLTMLGNQSRQSPPIDQHAAFAPCQASRRESKEAVRYDYGTRTFIHFVRGKNLCYHFLPYSLLLALQPAEEARSSPCQQERGS